MLRKNNGFFMIDLVLTLSSWLLISSTLLPLAIQFMVDSSNETEKYKVTIILYEKLHESLVEGQPLTSHIMEINGDKFEIISNPEQKEVCIQYEDHSQANKRICEYWE
jgi:competence protein ComGE